MTDESSPGTGPGDGSTTGEGAADGDGTGVSGETLQFRDRAVYLPAADAVVVADLHVGRDRTSDVQLPMGEREDLTDRLDDVLGAFDPAELVIAGDLLHAFDGVPEGARETLAALRGVAARHGADPVAVRGNHDAMLATVYDGPVYDRYRLADDTVVCHGHEAPTPDGDPGPSPGADPGPGSGSDGSPDGDRSPPGSGGPGDPGDDGADPARPVRRYVVGHDHPAIEIQGRRRPCFLLGRRAWRGTDVLMLPAFSRLAAGSVVNGARGRDLLSPLATDLDRFRPVVRDEAADETLRFPPLGEFRRLL